MGIALEEYPRAEKPNVGIPVLINVCATQTEIEGAEFFLEDEREPSDYTDSGVEDDSYSLSCRGMLKKANGRIYISYTEPAELDSEAEEGVVEISYLESEPLCITVTRGGSFSSAFVVEAKKRNFSSYETPFGSMEMCVWAKKVENSVDLEAVCGAIKMEYAVELKGLTAQKTKIAITLKKSEI